MQTKYSKDGVAFYQTYDFILSQNSNRQKPFRNESIVAHQSLSIDIQCEVFVSSLRIHLIDNWLFLVYLPTFCAYFFICALAVVPVSCLHTTSKYKKNWMKHNTSLASNTNNGVWSNSPCSSIGLSHLQLVCQKSHVEHSHVTDFSLKNQSR